MENNQVVQSADNSADSVACNKNTPNKLKLNIQRTILVGLAFFTITMFWQVYDSLMPLFLLDFGITATWRGVIMALDNVLALVLLPFMGLMSDKFPMKLRSKFGRRMPFILLGSVLAACTFILVNYAHNAQMLPLMLVATAFVLVFMCLYRTPAVALMPDVTPKQIRSQGNTVINIMGTVGGVVTLGLMTFLLKYEEREIDGEMVKFITGENWILVALIASFMVLAAFVMVFKVKENKLVEEKAALLKANGISEDEDADEPEKAEKGSTKKVLSALTTAQLKSLIFLLLSVFLWYMAYNGIVTHFSYFATQVIDLNGSFTIPLLLANVSAFTMFIPASIIGKKIGRKFTIMIGVCLLMLGFGFSSLLMMASPAVINIAMYPAFILIGAGWATINVHSYVMSVEMATEKTTGVFTGLYYTFAMSAQIITPILAGLVMDYINPKLLMVYSLIFSCLALATMFFVKHGNAKDGAPQADEPLKLKD